MVVHLCLCLVHRYNVSAGLLLTIGVPAFLQPHEDFDRESVSTPIQVSAVDNVTTQGRKH